MLAVNVATCELEEALERGAFRCTASTLGERLGAAWVGATVYEMPPGAKQGPYHYHHGIEEWMYVVSGAPTLRDPSGERTLAPGELVAFAAGPPGAHTVHGPGRIVMFSAGVNGWGEAFVTVYPDSDKIGAAPGVMFSRGDAVDSWRRDREGTPARAEPLSPRSQVDVLSVAAGASLRPLLGAETWDARVIALEPGEATAPYRYEWCREEWALVLRGAPTLRHTDGEDVLDSGSLVCFPQGPVGARQLSNHGEDTVRLVTFAAPAGRPRSTFYPDDETVLVHISDNEGYRFNLSDQIDDYWDGEAGAASAGAPRGSS